MLGWIFVLAIGAVQAARNVTIDDAATSQLVYSPASAWFHNSNATSDPQFMWFANTSSFAYQQGAYVEYNFTGTACYYYGGTGIDKSEATIYFDDTAYSVPLYSTAGGRRLMLWSITVPNGTHSFKLEHTGNDTNNNIAFDQLVYTVSTDASDNSSSTSVSTPTSSPESAASSTASTSSSSHIGAIVGGAVGGAAALGVVAAAGFFWWRTRRMKNGTMLSPGITVYEDRPQSDYSSLIRRASVNPFKVADETSSNSASGKEQTWHYVHTQD